MAQGVHLFRLGWITGTLRRSSACQSRRMDRIQNFLLFCERHRNRIAINGQRPTWAPPGMYHPEQLCDATDKQHKNNTFEYKSCKYLLRLKVTTNHCKYD